MLKKLTFAVALVAICFSLASELAASSKAVGGDSGGISGTDLGSGR